MLSISKAAAFLGVASVTLRRWEKKGLLIPQRTIGNHRRFTLSQLKEVIGIKPARQKAVIKQQSYRVAIYARVSQPIQKKLGQLDNQIEMLIRHARRSGYCVAEKYKDIASGMNPNRKGLIKLISDAARGKFNKVLISYPDRLSRFCVEYIERHLQYLGVDVEYLENKHESGAQEELVQDLLAVVSCFSGRLHGLRAKKNREREKKRMPQIAQAAAQWCIKNNYTSINNPYNGTHFSYKSF